MNRNLIANVAGWSGILCIHLATLPTTLRIIFGVSTAVPPLNMIMFIWAGLFLLLIRSITNKETLYMISNAIGFFFQTILLGLIIFG